MAGLPCEVCQEEAIVIPQGQIVDDEEGRTGYRRYRVCINPKCEMYRIRRESLELYLPVGENPIVVDTKQLREWLPKEVVSASRSPGLFDSFWITQEE